MSKRIEERVKENAERFHSLILLISVLGFVVYIVVVLLTYCGVTWLASLRTEMQGKTVFNLGLPFCAVGAYAVVALLLHVFPPEKQDGSIKLTAFGLEFTGPAGPISFWVVCFLSFIAAIKMLGP
ncbi:MAG: hypothetical protein ABSH49_36800 [Bryobacteraceae bacterium]|jgi:uncharacterized membrane protein (DUF485 family)